MKRTIIKVTFALAILYTLITLSACTMQEKLIFFPEKLANDFEFKFNGKFSEHFIRTGDSILLNALLFRSDSSKGCILYFHGNAGSLRSWGNVAEDFTKLGYDVLITDYRGFGKSGGSISSEKQLHLDALAVYNWLKEKYEGDNIIAYGRSIGTCIATKIAAENNTRKLILETPYYSFKKLARELYPFLPVSAILRYKLETAEYLKKVNVPVFLFHGTDDEVIPYHHSTKLEKEIPGLKLYSIPGGHHNDLDNFPLYHERLKEILSANEK